MPNRNIGQEILEGIREIKAYKAVALLRIAEREPEVFARLQ